MKKATNRWMLRTTTTHEMVSEVVFTKAAAARVIKGSGRTDLEAVAVNW